MKINSLLYVCFGLLLTARTSGAQTPRYTFTDLGLLPGNYQTYANGINSSGQVAETAFFGSGGT